MEPIVASVSITKLLTGLRSGDTSAELRLSAAYLASEHSYGKASRDLGVHYGQAVERTLVRRMALDVEQQAMLLAEDERRQALVQARREVQPKGVERLMLQSCRSPRPSNVRDYEHLCFEVYVASACSE